MKRLKVGLPIATSTTASRSIRAGAVFTFQRYMAAEFCNIQGGETIAVRGCGPVGQLAIRSAFLLGAGRVIAIDTVSARLALAKAAGAETLDFMRDDIYERIQNLTHGRGADACIDGVGTEPHAAASFDSVVDRLKVATMA